MQQNLQPAIGKIPFLSSKNRIIISKENLANLLDLYQRADLTTTIRGTPCFVSDANNGCALRVVATKQKRKEIEHFSGSCKETEKSVVFAIPDDSMIIEHKNKYSIRRVYAVTKTARLESIEYLEREEENEFDFV